MKIKKHTLIKINLIIILILISIPSTIKSNKKNHDSRNKFEIIINAHKISVEVADSKEERKRGLMWRKKLEKSTGMLFVYRNSAVRHFWMKNTYITLDIAFIDTNMVIRTIHTAKETNDLTAIYSSYVPVKYALEVNSGWFEQHGVSTGDTVIFDTELPQTADH